MSRPTFDFWQTFDNPSNNPPQQTQQTPSLQPPQQQLQPQQQTISPLQPQNFQQSPQNNFSLPQQAPVAPEPQVPQDPYTQTKPVGTLSRRNIDIQVVDSAYERPPRVVYPQALSDKGNCTPKFIRSTMYKIPMSGKLLKSSGLTLALSLQPFALPDSGEV